MYDAIQETIARLEDMHGTITDKRTFLGYSGWARIAGGLLAFVGSIILSLPIFTEVFPDEPRSLVFGWIVLIVICALINYTTMVLRCARSPEIRANPLMLRAVVDALPALAAGVVLTIVLYAEGRYDILPGTWLLLYSLVNTPYRKNLPFAVYLMGIAYLIAGAILLFTHAAPIESTWPLGVVLLVGESIAGSALVRVQHKSQKNRKGRDRR